jgi:hypothetical protein
VSLEVSKYDAGVPFLVLNLGFDIIDGIRRFHLKGDGLSGEGLDKDLHATRKAL